MRKLTTTVTFLEMRSDPRLHIPRPANFKLFLVKTEHPSAGFYRYLYDAVGRNLHWIDRGKLSDRKLLSLIRAEGIDIWVLYAGGVPAGYFEIDARDKAAVELEYFGLLPEFHGKGLGKWLLAEAVKACWAHKPRKVIVETCTLDGPAALPLYQRMGFTPYARRKKTMTVRETEP
jgi:GNAT superfamily N-acetyltransferase